MTRRCPCVAVGLRTGLPTGVRQILALNIREVLLQLASPAFFLELLPDPPPYQLHPSYLDLFALPIIRQTCLHLEAFGRSGSCCWEPSSSPGQLPSVCLFINKTFHDPRSANGRCHRFLYDYPASFSFLTFVTTLIYDFSLSASLHSEVSCIRAGNLFSVLHLRV